MTDEDILNYLKIINEDIYTIRIKDCLRIYYNGIDTNIEISGRLDNTTEWTLQTLKFELDFFLNKRENDKLIEEKSNEHKRINKRKSSIRRKSKNSKPKDRF